MSERPTVAAQFTYSGFTQEESETILALVPRSLVLATPCACHAVRHRECLSSCRATHRQRQGTAKPVGRPASALKRGQPEFVPDCRRCAVRCHTSWAPWSNNQNAIRGATMTFVNAGKVWTADELFAMTPNERHDVVQGSIVTDIDKVPGELLEQARSDIRSHIADAESVAPPTTP